MTSPVDTARRAFIARCGALGVGSTLFPGVLWAKVAAGEEITTASIAAAAEIAGVSFTPEEREQMLDGLKRQSERLEALHAIPLTNATAPAIVFSPLPRPDALPTEVQRPIVPSRVSARAAGRDSATGGRVSGARRRGSDLESLAFASVLDLADLVRRREVTSMQLTTMYLDRLARLDEKLLCVTTLTRERALERAAAADTEIAAGRYRGPLHGIPWGAKDLLAVTGYPTTWGAAPFRDQMFAEDATVVKRLDAAGAVLIAKLTLGELAQGDRWYGGRTRNPWNLEQGSSGSSAGPASATAAGCVGFSIGSETLGSISSPSTRCGVTGLRPTFGRVPRTGAMALSWSMDKLGPMCRTVEDCALVLAAIQGPDGADQSVHRAAFNWRGSAGARGLRVGYVQSAFERTVEDGHTTKPFDDAVLEVLRTLGVELVPVEIPDLDYNAMRIILTAEAGAAFDELTRSGRDEELAQQGPGAWPNTFRTSRLIPAVDYVNANRVRTLAIAAWDELMRDIDVIVAPTSSGQLTATNLTGHPAVILPNGFRENGTPVSITFLGRLFGEETLLRVAEAYQQATPHHLRHPELG
ncbi:MAG TPA: amidase [Gemmatimonadaceae bacterium]|nr:amidase [Gemmatimonadaceae bacterium]